MMMVVEQEKREFRKKQNKIKEMKSSKKDML